ncbi:MAG: hypothetical protein V1659_01020 [Candidatus Woesearchaeota archaeon]
MVNNDFTVILDQREGTDIRGARVGGAELFGKQFYMTGSTGLADSIKALLDEGLVHVPTYGLVAGRAFVGKEDEAWSLYHDSRAERITALDEKGIMGAKGTVYALDIQNGGLFVWNPQRIKTAVEGGNLVNYALQLEQEEVNAVLDAIKKQDTLALKQLVHGGNVAFAGKYDGFLEASASPDFLQGMDTTYLVIRPATEARKLISDRQNIDAQRENPDIIIALGGKTPAGRMLDKAEGFEWNKFGAWHDGYNNNNTGRVVCLGSDDDGVVGLRNLNYYGRPVGVAPEALDAFYGKTAQRIKLNPSELADFLLAEYPQLDRAVLLQGIEAYQRAKTEE